MIVSINQPAYLPWLGYFHRIAVSDHHVVLDHVQFEKNSFTNRNKVRTASGWNWLTVPVKTKGSFGDLGISQLEINNQTNWARKHWATMQQNYAKAPFFKKHADFFESVYQQEWSKLNDLCRTLTDYLLMAFDIKTPLSYSSALNPVGAKDDLVLNLCQEYEATTYLSGSLGRQYLDGGKFKQAGIEIVYQDYHHPSYPQVYDDAFEPYMGAIDLLFNCGPESLRVLLEDQEVLAK